MTFSNKHFGKVGVVTQKPWVTPACDVLDAQRYINANMTSVDSIARLQGVGPDDMGPRERKRSAPEVERVDWSGEVKAMTAHLTTATYDVAISRDNDQMTWRVPKKGMPKALRVGDVVEVLDGPKGVSLRVLGHRPEGLTGCYTYDEVDDPPPAASFPITESMLGSAITLKVDGKPVSSFPPGTFKAGDKLEVRVTSEPTTFSFAAGVARMTEGFKSLGEAAKALESPLTITRETMQRAVDAHKKWATWEGTPADAPFRIAVDWSMRDERANLAVAMARRSNERLMRNAERSEDPTVREAARVELLARAASKAEAAAREVRELRVRMLDEFDLLPDAGRP